MSVFNNTLVLFILTLTSIICNCLDSEVMVNVSIKNKSNLFYINTLQSPVIKNEMCRKQSDFYNEQLFEGSPFAVQMLDASSKLQTGILIGSMTDLGQFDECLNVYTETANLGELHGKHCIAKLTMKPTNSSMRTFAAMQKSMELKFGISQEIENALQVNKMHASYYWSICVPAVCSASDVEAHLQYTLRELFAIFNKADIQVTISDSACQDKTTVQKKIEAFDWFVIFVFGLIGALLVASTFYDFYLNDTEVDNIFLAFSIRRNYNEIISVNLNPNHFHCLNGIRCISMMWVILGHRYLLQFTFTVNRKDILEWPSYFSSQIILGATVSVDTFFVMSGALLCFAVMKIRSKNIPFNIPLFYAHRYLRLTPALLALLLFYISILKFISSGPLWPIFMPFQINVCKINWWQPLLYIQNYVGLNNMCMIHTWYLAVETQLFLLSPLILIPIYKWPKLGNILLVFLITLTTGVAFIISYMSGYKAGFIYNDLRDYYPRFYLPTYTRANTFLIGIGLGYILCINHKKTIYFNKMVVVVLWITAVIVLFAAVFGQYQFYQSGYEGSRLLNTSFVVLHRVGWSLAVCWVVFACVHGYGGPVNWFLSASIFQILSKLSYCMYLVHLFIIASRKSTMRVVPYIDTVDILYDYFGDLIVITLIALGWTLAFEIPFAKLETMLLLKRYIPMTVKEKLAGEEINIETEKSVEFIHKF